MVRMIVKLIGLVVVLGVLALAGFLADLTLNQSRIFYAVAGRGKLERDCRPLTLESLVGKGFSPTDFLFGEHPSIGFAAGPSGSSRTFEDHFTFSDGPNGPRVDGSVVCTVAGKSVQVDVAVDSLPQRTT